MKTLSFILLLGLTGCNSIPNYYGYKGNCRQQTKAYLKSCAERGINGEEVILLLENDRIHEVARVRGFYVDCAYKRKANSVYKLHKGCKDITSGWKELIE